VLKLGTKIQRLFAPGCEVFSKAFWKKLIRWQVECWAFVGGDRDVFEVSNAMIHFARYFDSSQNSFYSCTNFFLWKFSLLLLVHGPIPSTYYCRLSGAAALLCCPGACIIGGIDNNRSENSTQDGVYGWVI
jgi:hypothetical protein